jgi:hypothetical protein
MLNGESQKSKTCPELDEGLKIQNQKLRFININNFVTLSEVEG